MFLGLALVGSLVATSWVASQEESGSEKSRTKAPESGPLRPPAANARPADAAAAPTEALMLDKLNRAKTEPGAENLFETGTWEPPPPKVVARPGPPPAPAPPALPFTYFGKMGDAGQTIVFLDAGGKSYAARIGDVLDGQYRVEDIKDRIMVLTYLPLQQQQTLNIGD
jgi:hypothetical protein